MNKINHIIQGLYGISESEKMIPSESARFTLNKTIECLEIAVKEQNQNIYNKAIDDFEYACVQLIKKEQDTRYGFLDGMDIREIAKQLKESGKNDRV